MSKELCKTCRPEQKCFYKGFSLKSLTEAIDYGSPGECPQFTELLEGMVVNSDVAQPLSRRPDNPAPDTKDESERFP